MSRRSRFLVLAVLLVASPRAARAAEPDWPHGLPAEDEPRVSLWVSNRAGLVEAPFFTPAFRRVSGFASVLIPGAAVRLSSRRWLRLRVPMTFARLDFPARAQVAETALGNAELAFEQAVTLRSATSLGFVLAVLIPSAGHGPEHALLNNRALALGNATDGGTETGLLTPGATGVRLGGSLERSFQRFDFRTRLDLPLLVRVCDASLPGDAKTHSIGFLPSIEVRAAVRFTDWFAASLGALMVAEPFRLQEPARESERDRRVQLVVAPAVVFRVGRHVTLGLDGSVPLGGNLGGNAWGVGTLARFGL